MGVASKLAGIHVPAEPRTLPINSNLLMGGVTNITSLPQHNKFTAQRPYNVIDSWVLPRRFFPIIFSPIVLQTFNNGVSSDMVDRQFSLQRCNDLSSPEHSLARILAYTDTVLSVVEYSVEQSESRLYMYNFLLWLLTAVM